MFASGLWAPHGPKPMGRCETAELRGGCPRPIMGPGPFEPMGSCGALRPLETTRPLSGKQPAPRKQFAPGQGQPPSQGPIGALWALLALLVDLLLPSHFSMILQKLKRGIESGRIMIRMCSKDCVRSMITTDSMMVRTQSKGPQGP